MVSLGKEQMQRKSRKNFKQKGSSFQKLSHSKRIVIEVMLNF